MSIKLDMEALPPLAAELAMYCDFRNALQPSVGENPYEEEFWQEVASGLEKAHDGDYTALCGLSADPRSFRSGDAYYRCAQFAALFRKRNDVGDDATRYRAAIESFIKAEEACRKTNIFIHDICRRLSPKHDSNVMPGLLFDVLHGAKREIQRILGRCPSYDELPCYLGPGATTQVVRKLANARVKLGQKFACSESLLPDIKEILESMPDFTFRDFSGGESASVEVLLQDSRLSFVPKNYKTFRSIAVEPWLNSFFQLGIGRAMTQRLRSFGLDLSSQLPNQLAAREGSISGRLATIDLSSASDSLSLELVRYLLPDDWWEKIVHTRSSHMVWRSIRFKLEKVSSMGNGFTFPLQSLVFYTLTRAVCKTLEIDYSDVRAYGDDIIVPTPAYERTAAILALCGFTVNSEKSFHEGPFRESCGSDYWQGIDVRPIFLDHRPNYFDLFAFHNGLMRKHRPELAAIVKRFIPEPLALYGPDGYGDGHLIGYPFAPCFKRKHLARGWGGYTFDTYSRLPRRYTRPHPGDYLYPSYSVYRRGEEAGIPGGFDTLPGTRGYKRLSIYTLNLASVEA